MTIDSELEMLSLNPGDLSFNEGHRHLSTLLGSCVAFVVWHPQRRIGGMCHYVLPSRPRHLQGEFDGRYADEAMQMFLQKMHALGTSPKEYQVHVYGGANMFPECRYACIDSGAGGVEPCSSCNSVSCRNCHTAYQIIKKFELNAAHVDLGGTAYRQIVFNTQHGFISVKTAEVSDFKIQRLVISP